MPGDGIKGNWRVGRPGPLQDTQPRNVSFYDRPGPSNSIPARASGAKPAMSQATNWNPKQPVVQFEDHNEILLKHQYKQGMIINAPVHEPMNSNSKLRAPTLHESVSAYGNVYTKARYLIVVAKYETQYTCIPLYTHNKEGLRGKEHYKGEFVSVRDHRLSGDFKEQSDLKPLVTEEMTGPTIDPLSVAWLTHAVSRSYDLNCSVCGQLSKKSVTSLLRYFENEMRRGFSRS